MTLFPHLSWFINENGQPYLYRRDTNRRDNPNSRYGTYETCAEACDAAGIDLEDFIRSH